MITIETRTEKIGNDYGIIVTEDILSRMRASAPGSRLIFSVGDDGGASVRVKEPETEASFSRRRENDLKALVSRCSGIFDGLGDTPEDILSELRKGNMNDGQIDRLLTLLERRDGQ